MNQVVIITGASSGIGRATALEFAKRGARLVLGSRREGTAASLMKELGEERAVFRTTDVTSKRDLQALVELAVERFGRLDIAINNAALEAKAPIADFDEEMYGRVFDTNVKGIFLAMAAEIVVNAAKVDRKPEVFGDPAALVGAAPGERADRTCR